MHIILILINGPPLMAGPAINGPPSTALQATASSLKYSMLAAGNKTRPTCCPPPPPPFTPCTAGITSFADRGSRRTRMIWHGALMAASWALLLPAGILFPAHRCAEGRGGVPACTHACAPPSLHWTTHALHQTNIHTCAASTHSFLSVHQTNMCVCCIEFSVCFRRRSDGGY